MHLFLGQSPQIGRDILVGDFRGFFHALAFYEFSQSRTGCNGTGAAKRLEGSILNDAVRADFQKKLERVAAGKAAHFADSICAGKLSHIARVQEMFLNFVGIIPHNRVSHV